MMKKLAMLAIAATFFLSACDDDKKDDASKTGNQDTTQNPDTGKEDTTQNPDTGKEDTTQNPDTGKEDSTQNPDTGKQDTEGSNDTVDFAKFCDVVMGKKCGLNISDSDIASCVDTYKAEAAQNKDCEAAGNAYYLCVSKAEVIPCADPDQCECLAEDVCKTEIESYSSCIESAKPAVETTVDFEKFCNVVMGKACGHNISDSDITSCVAQYEAEAEQYKEACEDVGKAYYLCVMNAEVTPCSDPDQCECLAEDVCKTEIESYSSCIESAKPAVETTVDFEKFCNVVMGKACGHNISDSDITSCVTQYEAEAEQYKEACEDVGKAYYLCVMNAEVTPCADPDQCECLAEDVCKTEIESYSSCIGE